MFVNLTCTCYCFLLYSYRCATVTIYLSKRSSESINSQYLQVRTHIWQLLSLYRLCYFQLSHKQNHVSIMFCKWLLSLNMQFSRVRAHLFFNMKNTLFLFIISECLMCEYVIFIFPFICCYAFELCPLLFNYELCLSQHSHTGFYVNIRFLNYIHRKGNF